MLQDPTPHLDIAYKVIHIVGIPALVAGLIWVVRTFDASQRQWKDIDMNAKAAATTSAQVQLNVETMKNNHMAHMEVELKDQTALLVSMDKNISIIADRTPRTVEVITKINHTEV
jgi:hypothetical protein